MERKIYQVIWGVETEKDLKKVDKNTIRKLKAQTNEVLSKNPQAKVKSIKKLSGDWEGFWRYRWGDYRVIYKIVEEKVLVFIVKVGNRNKIYD